MGRPSDKIHSALRPGRKERERRKKHHRAGISIPARNVPSGGHGFLKLGRKKWARFNAWISNELLSSLNPS